MVSFDNTETAFQAKNGGDLNRSYWLFKLIGNPGLVKMGASLAPVALSLGMGGLIKRTIFRQFVGGENINDCSNAINELGKYGIGGILDYSVEGKESEADFDHCRDETIATFEMARQNKNIPFCVFKVTGLARFGLLEKVTARAVLTKEESQEWERVRARVAAICDTAVANKQPVFIDAEESWIQQAIDDLANENIWRCNKDFAIVYNTFQLYRHDRYDYLNWSIEEARKRGVHLGAKLVRGAYMEKERERAAQLGYTSPIQPDKVATDRDYDRAVELCVNHLEMTAFCAGTHNEKSSALLAQRMNEKGIPHADTRIYFSQLYGMSDHISYNLAADGYKVSKYVPYGPVKEVLPYLIRRAMENTSVKGQTGRELGLIIKEKKRRAR
jgi:proline dehydrogenase